jgi:hypothetical protein
MSSVPQLRLMLALAALTYSCNVMAETPQKWTFKAYGSFVEIPPFSTECLSVHFAGFGIGENLDSSSPGTKMVVFNFFGDNLCTGEPFSTFGIQRLDVALEWGPAKDSLVGSGTIIMVTVPNPREERIDFTITVTASDVRANRTWGTVNVSDANYRNVRSFDNLVKPAVADLEIRSSSLVSMPFDVRYSLPTSIGSQNETSTTLALPR